MVRFMLRQLHALVDAISVLADRGVIAVHLKFSQELCSIIAKASPFCQCIIALQLFPQFFERYSCPILQRSWMFFPDFYRLFDLELSGHSLTFSYSDPDRADLIFESPDGRRRESQLLLGPWSEAQLPLSSSSDSMDDGYYDCGTFVLIDSQEFINILTPFSDVDYVLVTLTNSHVKFSSKSVDIYLSPKGGCCVIGGVAESNRIQFEITLKPTKFFDSVARRSKLVWLFKSNDYNQVSLLCRVGDSANIEYSQAMFSIAVSHHSFDLIVAFQMMPQFFARFITKGIYKNRIFLRPLYSTIKGLQQRHFSSMCFFVLQRLNRIILRLWNPRYYEQKLIRKFGLSYSIEQNVGEIDMGIFVSVDSQEFRRIVRQLNGYLVRVILTDSHVKFSIGVNEIVLAKEERQCIMKGVTTGEETEFLIPLTPLHIFYNITFLSERVWLFKTTDSSSMIVAPVGIFAEFTIYCPYTT